MIMQMERENPESVTADQEPPRVPRPRLFLNQFLTRPNSRLIIEADDHTKAADHYKSILQRAQPPDLIKLRPRLFFTRCSGSGRYWIFQRTECRN